MKTCFKCGPCPDGMEACHNNGDASDNRPENLRWDTHHNNNQDRLKHGTYRRGVDHHSNKLSEDDVRAIMADPSKGRDIAKRYGVAATVVSKIKNGELWSHIEGHRVPSAGIARSDYARGERAPTAKLTAEKVRAIRLDPRSQHVIAAEYGVTQSSIWQVKTGKSWSHVR